MRVGRRVGAKAKARAKGEAKANANAKAKAKAKLTAALGVPVAMAALVGAGVLGAAGHAAAAPQPTLPAPAREAPWHLTASASTMSGLTYNGVVTVQTAAGPVRALDFTATSADLADMVTWAPVGGTAAVIHNDAGRGSHSLLTGVHLHVTRLAGNMYGVFPVTFTPDNPPPLIPGVRTPVAVLFTDVSQDNLLLTAKTLTVPGYQVRATGS